MTKELYKPILKVELGSKHICVVHSPPGRKLRLNLRSRIKCWGSNLYGQAQLPKGQGKGMHHADRIVMLAVGFDHTCRITSRNSLCWGSNAEGQSDIPEGYAPGGELKVMSAGGFHTCAVDQRNRVVCWGGNLFGQANSAA
mmetsp:Transcript_40572/g.34255  ORF Transcript_40572/g.34255 Transcript_40572/m.34255 type:complete len:141 (-) Transcript_40572:419-841(-)